MLLRHQPQGLTKETSRLTPTNPARRTFRVSSFLWRPRGCHPHPRQALAAAARSHDHDAVLSFADLKDATGGDCYVAELADAKIIGEAKLVATSADTVLGGVQFLYGTSDPLGHRLLKRGGLRLPQRLEGTVSLLAASNGDNYYHWLFDSLPRLWLLQRAGFRLEDVDWFILNQSRPAFQVQTLEKAGIARSKLRYTSKYRIVQCRRLLVPSMPGRLGYAAPWACRYLRELFLPKTPLVADRKIYISRQNAQGRKILNEADIVPILARHGFEIVHAERLNFDEQVRLFASARQVVAIHGAGMSNLVWCPPGTTVLELGSPTHHNECFSTIAANGGLAYDHLFLDQAPAGAGDQDPRFGNLIVKPDEFERKLEQMSR